MYHGGGGFKHEEVYNMPTWLRLFHIGKINEHHEKQNQEIKKSQGKEDIGDSKIHRTDIPPSSVYNF